MEDCYYYYNSLCTKGSSCLYRHEPSARNSSVICTFWKKGICSNFKCSFRHGTPTGPTAAASATSATTNCYWETQQGGCRKPTCPFLHTGLPPVSASAAATSTSATSSTPSKIIVNKAKLEELNSNGQSIVINQGQYRLEVNLDGDEPSTRIVKSAKSRLGLKSIKERLGNIRDDDEEEEKALRRYAIQSIDLRNRLSSSNKEDNEILKIIKHEDIKEEKITDEEEEGLEEKKVKSVVKKVKKEKKEKKKKKKKEKKKKRDKNNDENYSSSNNDDEEQIKSSPPSCNPPQQSKINFGIAAKTLRDLKNQKIVREVEKRKINDEDESHEEIGGKKIKMEKHQKELEEIFHDDSITDAINESVDVMKELDEIING